MTLPTNTQAALDNGAKGIEVREGGAWSASGPDAVNLVRLVVIRKALEFEIRTGMKMSRVSALKAANEALGTNYKTKQKALGHLDGLLEMHS